MDLVGRIPKETREEVVNLLRNLDDKPQDNQNMPGSETEEPTVTNSTKHGEVIDSPGNILRRMWNHLWGS